MFANVLPVGLWVCALVFGVLLTIGDVRYFWSSFGSDWKLVVVPMALHGVLTLVYLLVSRYRLQRAAKWAWGLSCGSLVQTLVMTAAMYGGDTIRDTGALLLVVSTSAYVGVLLTFMRSDVNVYDAVDERSRLLLNEVRVPVRG